MARLQAKRFVTFYDHLLTEHPLSTKCTTAAILAVTGDSLAQAIGQYRSTGTMSGFKLDVDRSLTFCLAGGVVPALMFHPWYNWLDRLPKMLSLYKPLSNLGKFQTLAIKIGFDQVTQLINIFVNCFPL